MTSIEFYLRRIHILGAFFLVVSLLAWISDWTGLVYVCPYCRLQRTVIGILGFLMMFRGLHNIITIFIASVLGFMGAHVAAAQNFMGWLKINKGTFEFKGDIYLDPFLLSGAALFAIIAQVWLLVLSARSKTIESEVGQS
ncbi:hypothetical protein [Thalassomonas actiniarum]|uniref:Uncharacterized protein n=1 Tax=Thalassomonas actiniarum TaxID=485447 RepID=A0AAE9YMF3_9GAMM|nr:hypothetical protein [Thalassomonas actiniarum]WDD97572.1 hypothetical protein SG35_019955 [Thalassomonas actiniarum]